MMEKRYFITDASKMVDVEAHVLRYWEEELMINIPRNEMGHRYYTDFHVELMKKVKELKAEGLQLKAIRNIIPEIKSFEDIAKISDIIKEHMVSPGVSESHLVQPHPVQPQPVKPEYVKPEPGQSRAVTPQPEASCLTTENVSITSSQSAGNLPGSKLEQFQLIIGQVVTKALADNNVVLEKNVTTQVSDKVIKEMDYLMRLQDEQEEERYKKLDEIIRKSQESRKENASLTEKSIFSKFQSKILHRRTT